MNRALCLVCMLALLLTASSVPAQEPEKPREPAGGEPAGSGAEGEGGIKQAPNFEAALEQARKKDCMVMIYFYREGSKMCAEFEKFSINHPAVVELSKNFVCIKVEKNKEKKIAQQFGVGRVPYTRFIDANRKKLGEVRGFEDPEPFAKKVKEIYESIAIEKKAREILSKDRENLEANLQLAKVWVIRDYRDQAIALFKKVVDGDPRNKKGLLVEAAFRLGFLQFKNGLYVQARENFKKAKRYDARDEKGFGDDMLLAEAHMDLTDRPPDMDAALKKLRLFAIKYSDSEFMPQALFRLGYIYSEKKDNAKAIEVWEKLVKEYPSSGEAEQAKYMIPQLKKQRTKDAGTRARSRKRRRHPSCPVPITASQAQAHLP